MKALKFPLDIDTTPEDDRLYSGFGKQDLKFHQALCELIDNSISAVPDDRFFVVEIHIEKRGDDIFLMVADNGEGISLSDILTRILKIGGRGSNPGRMNEHGFGLKNSLCVLTQNERQFSIVTRDKDAVDNDLIYIVKGPFRRNMKLEKGSDTDWREDITRCTARTGTRVSASTTMHYLGTLYPSATRLDSLVVRLLEHLGVLYRTYLSADPRNEIWIRWRDNTGGNADWNDDRVAPIKVSYLKAREEWIPVELNGKQHKVFYKWGELDKSAVEDSSKGKPYPLKIYYQKNQRTQGIDISVRGRVILPHTLEYLWPELNRHNDFNSFVGELMIEDAAFSTVNNKTELDPNNPVWEKLLECLEHDKYKPPRTAGTSFTEKEIRSKLKSKLESIVSGSTAEEDFPTWAGLGVKIDIMHHIPKENEEIYELKAGVARPIDVYQLVMYWDGRVKDGVRPRLGRLVAREANQHVVNLIEYWNTRDDAEGEKYRLEFRRVDELL